MIHHFHHRATTYHGVPEHDRQAGNARSAELSELQDPWFRVKARCWVEDTTFTARMDGRPWPYTWFVSMRDITNTTNERTAIFTIRPGAPGVDKLPSLFLRGSPGEIAWLVGSLSSFMFDYVARQKVGGTNLGGYIVEQLPVPPRGSLKLKRFVTPEPLEAWLVSRILELTYTAWDLESFATDCGYDGPPFRWTKSAASCCAANSMRPTSTSTASGATTWTTFWRPSPSSNARTSRPTTNTARSA
jgi:hypothetical protein